MEEPNEHNNNTRFHYEALLLMEKIVHIRDWISPFYFRVKYQSVYEPSI